MLKLVTIKPVRLVTTKVVKLVTTKAVSLATTKAFRLVTTKVVKLGRLLLRQAKTTTKEVRAAVPIRVVTKQVRLAHPAKGIIKEARRLPPAHQARVIIKVPRPVKALVRLKEDIQAVSVHSLLVSKVTLVPHVYAMLGISLQRNQY